MRRSRCAAARAGEKGEPGEGLVFCAKYKACFGWRRLWHHQRHLSASSHPAAAPAAAPPPCCRLLPAAGGQRAGQAGVQHQHGGEPHARGGHSRHARRPGEAQRGAGQVRRPGWLGAWVGERAREQAAGWDCQAGTGQRCPPKPVFFSCHCSTALATVLPCLLYCCRNVMYHGDSRITALPPYLTVQVGAGCGGVGCWGSWMAARCFTGWHQGGASHHPLWPQPPAKPQPPAPVAAACTHPAAAAHTTPADDALLLQGGCAAEGQDPAQGAAAAGGG